MSPGVEAEQLSLHYRDVLVLCDNYPWERTERDGRVRVNGLVQGLRECNVPVRIVTKGDTKAIDAMALAASDEVTVTKWKLANGLERKVIVVLNNGNKTRSDMSDRMQSATRCSSQLIRIDCDTMNN